MKVFSLLAALLVFTIIGLVPLFLITADSFIHDGGFTLQSYREVLSEARQLTLFVNSLVLGGGVAVLSLLIGVPLAFLVTRTDLVAGHILKSCYLIPLIIPPHIHTVAWITLLGTNGYVNNLLTSVLGGESPFFSIYGLPGSLFILTLSYFPIVTLLTVSGLHSMDSRLEEAARLAGSGMRVNRRIILPLLLPNILTGMIFVAIFSMLNYSVPSLLRLQVYPVEIFAYFSAFYDVKGAVAQSVPIVLVCFLLLWLQKRLMGEREYFTIGARPNNFTVYSLQKWRVPALCYAGTVFLFSVVVPLTTLFIQAGSWNTYLVAMTTAQDQIKTSLLLSTVAATCTTVLMFFLAYFLEKTRWPGRGAVGFLSFIPFAVPPAILAIGMIQLWNRTTTEFLYSSVAVVIFALMAKFSPFALRAIGVGLRNIHYNLEEALQLVTHSWLKLLCRIVVPLSLPGLVAGWSICFIFCMGELGASLLLVPPGQATLSLRIFSLMHYGAGNLVAALCLILIAITLLPVMVLLAFQRYCLPKTTTAA